MKIYTRRSRSIRNLIIALLWLSLVVYQVMEGISLGPKEMLFILAAMVFIGLFYIEWNRPYVEFEGGLLKVGIFSKRSMKLEEVESFEAKAGVLRVYSNSKNLPINMMRLSQEDRERIYEELRTKMPEEASSFLKDNQL